jgi:[acyl-carrier-protein] S-malonyltransferase
MLVFKVAGMGGTSMSQNMPQSTYILCPGQGAQVVGMGKDYYDASPAAREVFDAANDAIGFDLKALCFGGPEEELNKTNISQPAIYVTSVACHRAAVASGIVNPAEVTAYAGLSLGEYTALHLGGAFSFLDGLKLVKARGEYMQQAAVAVPSSMVAIMGADDAAVTKLCAECAGGEVLVPANYNAPGQIVVSGASAACERFAKAAEIAGFKTVVLKVAGAFHSPLMQSGADRMAAELDRVELKPPMKPVYANVTAQPHTSAAEMKRLLIEQIVRPVRWEQTMQTLDAAGEARYVELAPGRTLTGLLKKINRRIPVESLASVG